MNLKNFITLYAGVAKRVLTTMTGVGSQQGRQQIQELYNFYSKPKFDPAAFPKDPYKVPKTDVFELIDGDKNLNFEGVYECGFGHLTEFELKVVGHLTQYLAPKNVFEIGTFEGRTTLNLALNTSEIAKVYTLDLPHSLARATQMPLEPDEIKYVLPQPGKRFEGHDISSKITQLMGDTANFDFSPYQNSMDLVIVDGSHAPDYVANDTQKALSMVRNGGTIIWANYTTWVGVRNTLNSYFESKSQYENLRHIGGTSLVVLKVKK
jgi:predicted O-methyltransferase YrrM